MKLSKNVAVCLLALTAVGVIGDVSASSLHIFQSKPGNQIYTTYSLSAGVKVRGDKLYYRRNPNLNGTVVFDADQYGKNSVLLSATLGKEDEVYVLANLQKGQASESTVLKIKLSNKVVISKISLQAMGFENVSPATFSYDASLDAVKINASRGYTTYNGAPSANYGTYWVSVKSSPKIVKSKI